VSALLIESLVVLAPGAIMTAALFPPGSLSIPGRLALMYVVGYSAVAVVTWILATMSVLTATTLLVALGAVSLGAAILAWRRGSAMERFRQLANELRAELWPTVLGLAVMVAVATIRVGFSPLRSFLSYTALRFWGDGVEIATAGEIPQRTLQWGQSIAPAASKMLFNCFTAAMDLVSGPDTLPSIAGATLLPAVFVVPALWWLGRELGLGLTAPILPLVVTANLFLFSEEFAADLTPFRAESFGRVVAFSALALCIVAIRTRAGWFPFAFAGFLFGVAALTHLVPTVIALGILGWIAVYELVRRRLSLQVGLRLAGGLILAALMVPLVWFLPGATLGFTGVKGPAPVVGPVEGIDPTRLFATGRRVPLEKTERTDWYLPPQVFARRLVESTVGVPVQNGWLWLGLAGAGTVLLTILAPDRLRPAGVAALALGANIMVATLIFARFYDSFAMALFGPRRLFDYAPIVVWLLLLLMLELFLKLAGKLHPGVPIAIGVACGLVLMALLLPDLREMRVVPSAATVEVEVLNWVRDNTPCDARILSNKRTSGAFQVLSGRVGVNEGMGPFFRPELMDRVNRFLIETNRFYAYPFGKRKFLARYGVDYVVLFRGAGGTRDLKKARGFPQVMERTNYLTPVYSTDAANIYRVEGAETNADLPQAADHPGYVCQTGAIEM
jgi:hypothetical protein